MIEKKQKHLRGIMKALSMEVKDFIAALQFEVNELVAIMKMIIITIGKTLIVSDALECKGKSKVLELRPDTREKNVQKDKEYASAIWNKI